MKIGSYEFNLRELAGSMGDFGTLLPLAIGYITICKVEPTGLLVMMGLANIITGLVYRLPLPIEPMKVLAIMAIAQAWSPDQVFTSGIVMGVTWLLISVTGAMTLIARWTPITVVRGIQISLGILLAIEGVKMVSSWWLLGIVAVVIVAVFRKNRYAPAAILLVILGIAIMAFKGQLAEVKGLSFSFLTFRMFDISGTWMVIRDGCLAQIPLTATNAVIATSVLISKYWPDRRVTERQLSFNMGIMNLIIPFFGGMPLCHGAGGLAGQYYFGARTGGANIMEGVIEISLGLFLAASISTLFSAFPVAILGAMMFLVGVELVKFIGDIKFNLTLIPVVVTVIGAVAVNMAVGFIIGIVAHYALFRTTETKS